MSRMSSVYQTVQEMRINGSEIKKIAETLGISRSLIDHLDTNDNDFDYYNYQSQSEHFNDNSILF